MDENKIALKLLNHDRQFEHIKQNMVTKKEFKGTTDTLDKILKLVQRQDQERIFLNKGIGRVESTLEDQQKEITKIKKVLNVS